MTGAYPARRLHHDAQRDGTRAVSAVVCRCATARGVDSESRSHPRRNGWSQNTSILRKSERAMKRKKRSQNIGKSGKKRESNMNELALALLGATKLLIFIVLSRLY
jgi:hypothetical protein